MDTDKDLFDSVKALEYGYYREGIEEGKVKGRLQGIAEGKQIGERMGSEVGKELGIYAGYIAYLLDNNDVFNELLSIPTTGGAGVSTLNPAPADTVPKSTTSAMRFRNNLQKSSNAIATIRTLSPENEEFSDRLESIRAKCKPLFINLQKQFNTSSKHFVMQIPSVNRNATTASAEDESQPQSQSNPSDAQSIMGLPAHVQAKIVEISF
jgi:hypothetical protein